MDFNFPIFVSNKRAFIKLMESIEEYKPDVLWYRGEKPTDFCPPTCEFPIRVFLGFKVRNRLTYESKYD